MKKPREIRNWGIPIWLVLLIGCTQVESQDAGSHGHREGSGRVEVEVKTPVLTRIEEFHGHIGPYVVLGYKMGMMARDLLDSPGYFDLTVDVESALTPPPSCLVDGIQLGSGCTTGKRNLTVREGPIGKATFRTKTGRTAVLRLRPDVSEKIGKWIEEIGVERSGKRILDLSSEEIIERLD